MKVKFYFIFVVVTALLTCAAEFTRAESPITEQRLIQLTNDDVDQPYADIWGNHVVWQQGSFGSDTDIYALNLDDGQVKNLTAGVPLFNSYPAIHKNLVVWSGYDDVVGPNEAPINADIWLYDLDANSVTLLIDEGHTQLYARIWGRYVVWQDWRNMPPNIWDPANHDIFGYDLQTETEFPICVDPNDDLWPDIWENLVVYQSKKLSVTKYDIFVYDINTGAETCITEPNDYDAWEPRIHDGKVTWFGGPSMFRGEVYVQDLTTGQRWSSGLANWNEFSPRIWGSRVVWRSGIHFYELPNWTLRTWNLQTGQTADLGWTGNCLSQEGHNVYKGLTVFCQKTQLTPTDDQWDVWLACSKADLNCDGDVNFLDFAEFAQHWLE